MILRGSILAFQHTQRAGTICWFLRNQRQAQRLNRAYFAGISGDYHAWINRYAQEAGVAIVEPEKGVRREDWVEPYFQELGTRHGIAVILKAREPERIACHFAKSNDIKVESRHVNLFYFYLNDPHCGRMFVRLCPYFPFNITVWVNGHNWLACQLQREGIAACAQPQRLQELSDAFAPADIIGPVESWVARLLPFFSDAERQQGYRHQLYMAQIEYCHNLIFHKQAAAHRLFDRLMDANRAMGHPNKLATVFGRAGYRPDTRTGQTVVKITKLRTPVLCSSYKNTSLKQYISNHVGMRTESSSYQLKDLALGKNINNLPKVREVMNKANHRYLQVQQEVLASYVDRGQLEQLRQPTVSASGRRVPGLHIDDPRLLAVLQAILCFAYLVGKGCFRTKDLLVDVQKALSKPDYTLSQLRYDLSKLRGKGLVRRCPGTHAYQVSEEGYRIGFFHLKLYQKLYAPLTAAICEPDPADNGVLTSQQTKLDRLYVTVDKALQNLVKHLGMARKPCKRRELKKRAQKTNFGGQWNKTSPLHGPCHRLPFSTVSMTALAMSWRSRVHHGRPFLSVMLASGWGVRATAVVASPALAGATSDIS
jgi:hypothetical protein